MDTCKINLVIFVIVVQAMHQASVQCRPGGSHVLIDPVTAVTCTSKRVEELCQKCAKHTKSTLVYPMCCNNEEDAQDFCERYLGFGLQDEPMERL